MPYAILQKNLSPPSAEQLKRAFRALPALTDADAALMARDAFGILVGGLSPDEAGKLLQALTSEGVEAEIVQQQDLPALEPAKKLKKADCSPSALTIYDQLGRPADVEWSNVLLLAAGSVSLTEFERVQKQRTEFRIVYPRIPIPVTRTDVTTREVQNFRLVLEIFLDEPLARCHVDAREFQYDYLGPRLQHGRAQNFSILVADLHAYAPAALLSRGAQSIIEDPTKTFQYPSRHAFEEESIWLLWQAGRQNPQT